MFFMTFKEFVKDLGNDKVEGEIVKTMFYSLLVSFITFGIFYFLKLKDIENLFPKYGFYMFFAFLSYAIILSAFRQVRCFKEFPCMSGMMIGMTMGMMSGFLAGYFVGAINGMFYGGIFGMAVGIGFGMFNGSCCGVMGVLEGIMAGFMGGLMGAMTAVMMINDSMKIMGGIVFVVCAVIMIGLNYMVHKESNGLERNNKIDQFSTVVISFILTTITIWLMVFGPRSAFLQ